MIMRNEKYTSNINKIKQRRALNTHLTIDESRNIIKNECPYCEYEYRCFYNSKGGDIFCIKKSTDLDHIWIRPQIRKSVEIGKTYGKYMVIELAYKNIHGDPVYKCEYMERGLRKTKLILSKNLLRMCGNDPPNSEKKKYKIGSSRNPDGSRHKFVISNESNVNKSIYYYTTEKRIINDVEMDVIVSKVMKCDECGGIIRYNKHSEKQCEKCGLIF